MKAVFKRIRFSRKLVLIGGGILLLGGASGVAAIMLGKERFFGGHQVFANGLECEIVQTVSIKKNGSVWVRKFIRTENGDGTDRVKTALRIAKAIYDQQKPDLVQVSVLDQHGPTMRSDMRGRAIAAQVVFIPDTKKLPADTNAQTYSAYYYDGAASSDGQFYGLRIDLPLEDTEHLASALTEFTNCTDPAAEAAAAAADAHGASKGGHGKADAGHGDSGGHGDAKPADAGHGEAAPGSAHGESHGDQPSATHEPAVTAPADLLTSTPAGESESMFSFAYIKSLIFGKGTTTAVAAEPAVADAPADHGEGGNKADEAAKAEH